MSETQITTFLAEHPKMTGALFTILLLLTQAQSVMAGAISSNPGP